MSDRPGSARLIGRIPETTMFRAVLDRAAQGESSVVLVGGDAGIGKTRLLDEWTRTAGDAGARMLVGASVPMGASAVPYAPVVEGVRRIIADTPPPQRRATFGPPSAHRVAATLVPELDVDEPAHVTVALAPVESQQTRLFDQLVGVIERAATRQPLVLAIDDLHWADQSTLDLVAYIANALDRARVVLVLAYRTDELTRTHPLRPLLARLQRRPRVTALTLSPLDRAELAELIGDVRGAPPSSALLDDIHARSEGNPFFAEELLAATVADDAPLPSGLQDLLLSRVDRLSPHAQAVVRVAAAVGRSVDDELLRLVVRRATELTETALLEALRDAVAGQVLVVDDEDAGYRFRHALLQEAVHVDLLPGERVRLHRMIAGTLAERPDLAGDGGVTAALAWHYAASHDHAEALVASLDAASASREAMAYADALAHLERALELWDSVPDATRRTGLSLLDVLSRAASVAWRDRNASRSASFARQALGLIDEDADPTAAALAWMRLARALHNAGAAGAFDAYARAVALLPAAPTADRARVLAAYANALMLVPRYEEARAVVEQAVLVARDVDAPVQMLHALTTLATVRAGLGELDLALEAFDEAAALVRRHRLLEADKIYANRSEALYQNGRIADAIAVSREGVRWADEHGLARSAGVWQRGNLAQYLVTLGRLAEAASALAPTLGMRDLDVMELHVRLQSARIHLARGAPDAAEADLSLVDRVRHGMAAGAQFEEMRAEVQATLALVRADPVEALHAASAGLDVIERADGVRWHGGCLYALAMRAAAMLGDEGPARARDVRRRLDAARSEASWGVGRLWSAHARVADAEHATLVGDADAQALWRDAVAEGTALGLLPTVTHARIRLAELLMRSDRDAAADVLRVAWRDADGAGLAVLRQDAERTGRRGNLRLGATEATPFGLTPRERDVLVLIARGATNPQIGDALFISRKTASSHVSNILRKLGAATRGEAAAVAHRHGLTGDGPT